MASTLTRYYIWNVDQGSRYWGVGTADETVTVTDYIFNFAGIHSTVQESDVQANCTAVLRSVKTRGPFL